MNKKELDESAVKEIYFNEFDSLNRVALYLVKDAAVAEDVVQEVFIKLWEKRAELEHVKDIQAYLVRMTRNRSLDKLKSSKKLQKFILELEPVSEPISDSEKETAIRKALEIALSQLTPQCRLIFSLSRFEGLSNDEIATYLDLSKRTVETQISNALKAFRTDLRPIFEAYLSMIVGFSIITFLQQI